MRGINSDRAAATISPQSPPSTAYSPPLASPSHRLAGDALPAQSPRRRSRLRRRQRCSTSGHSPRPFGPRPRAPRVRPASRSPRSARPEGVTMAHTRHACSSCLEPVGRRRSGRARFGLVLQIAKQLAPGRRSRGVRRCARVPPMRARPPARCSRLAIAAAGRRGSAAGPFGPETLVM